MKMPNWERAIVDQEKITQYLLSYAADSGKAAFFISFGFSLDLWQLLAAQLIQHAAQHELRSQTMTEHGVKYVIEGELSTPDGRNPQVRTVWITEHGKTRPRLVTAYPLKGQNYDSGT